MNSDVMHDTASGRGHVGWASAGFWLVFAAAFFWFASPVLAPLHKLWSESFTYSHGYLVLAIAAWLVFRALRAAPPQGFAPSYPGAVALAVCVAGVLAGYASQTQIVFLALLPLLPGAAWLALMGFRNAAPILLGIGYLYFAIPVWDYVNEPLRALTTNVVGVMVRTSGIPAFIEGNLIHVPSGTFEVAGGCSGLHFFIVALALAVLCSLVQYRTWRARFLLVLVAASLAIAANWVRVFTLVAVGHVTEMQHYLITVDHYYFGWALFAAALAPLFFIAPRLERRDAAWAEASDRKADAPPAGPRHRSASDAGSFAALVPSQLILLGIAVAVLCAGGMFMQRIDSAGQSTVTAAPVRFPALPGWTRIEGWNGAGRPIYRGAAAEAAVRYVRDDREVRVYFASYLVQQQGRELVFYANRPQGEEQVLSRDDRWVQANESLRFRELLVGADDRPRLVWYAMQVAGWRTVDEVVAKGYQALGAFAGRGDAQVLVLSALCDGDCDRARSTLETVAGEVATPMFSSSDIPDQ